MKTYLLTSNLTRIDRSKPTDFGRDNCLAHFAHKAFPLVPELAALRSTESNQHQSDCRIAYPLELVPAL